MDKVEHKKPNPDRKPTVQPSVFVIRMKCGLALCALSYLCRRKEKTRLASKRLKPESYNREQSVYGIKRSRYLQNNKVSNTIEWSYKMNKCKTINWLWLLYFKIANNKFSALNRNSAENLLFLQRKTSDMTNETTTSILEYADTHLKFSMEDLFAYLHKKIA